MKNLMISRFSECVNIPHLVESKQLLTNSSTSPISNRVPLALIVLSGFHMQNMDDAVSGGWRLPFVTYVQGTLDFFSLCESHIHSERSKRLFFFDDDIPIRQVGLCKRFFFHCVVMVIYLDLGVSRFWSPLRCEIQWCPWAVLSAWLSLQGCCEDKEMERRDMYLTFSSLKVR